MILNLIISLQQGTNKIYLYAKDPQETDYQFLINKGEDVDFKKCHDFESFIEYLNDMDDIYEHIEEYNLNKERKILMVFDDIIADILSNKKGTTIVTELTITGRKINISLVFIILLQSYFTVLKNIRLNSTHYFNMNNQ